MATNKNRKELTFLISEERMNSRSKAAQYSRMCREKETKNVVHKVCTIAVLCAVLVLGALIGAVYFSPVQAAETNKTETVTTETVTTESNAQKVTYTKTGTYWKPVETKFGTVVTDDGEEWEYTDSTMENGSKIYVTFDTKGTNTIYDDEIMKIKEMIA